MENRRVLIPQMGEGLQEVRIISFAKQPGDHVRRDEIIYSMETDKANLEVESPVEGVLTEWLAKPGDVLPIGAPIAMVQAGERSPDIVESDAKPTEAPKAATLMDTQPAGAFEGSEGRPRRVSPLAAVSGGEPLIPPRTRAYCRELGISEEEMRRIHAPSGKLMPADVDAYRQGSVPSIASSPKAATSNGSRKSAPYFIERQIPAAQRTFVMRIKRSQQIVVPAVVKRSIDWSIVRRVADARKLFGGPQPSSFQTFAFAAAQAVRDHAKFRSIMPSDETLREYEHVNLGIAVGLPTGQLNVAVVSDADALTYDEFVQTAQANIESARSGADQANESVQLLLTYMGPYEIEDGIPLLVAPAVGVLFIGSTFEVEGKPRVNLTLTFDHRLIQGVEAAEFLKTVAQKATDLETWRIA